MTDIKKPSEDQKAMNLFFANQIFAVFDLSLQHDLLVLEQQDFAFAHFLPFPFPQSAKETPAKSNDAVASKNTFFILLFLCEYLT